MLSLSTTKVHIFNIAMKLFVGLDSFYHIFRSKCDRFRVSSAIPLEKTATVRRGHDGKYTCVSPILNF